MAERRWHAATNYSATTDQLPGSSGHQPSTISYQQASPPQRRQLTSLAVDPSPPFTEVSRFSDPVHDRATAAHNRSITDTDKLRDQRQQHLHGNGCHGDHYRGDDRVPSRYSVDEVAADPVFANPGRYSAERSCFRGDVSASSHGRRLPWSEMTSRAHCHSQVRLLIHGTQIIFSVMF